MFSFLPKYSEVDNNAYRANLIKNSKKIEDVKKHIDEVLDNIVTTVTDDNADCSAFIKEVKKCKAIKNYIAMLSLSSKMY